MNRTERRKRLAELGRFARKMHAEGQGVWNLELYGPDERVPLLMAAMMGDAKAEGIVRQVAKLATADPPCLCLLCPATFGRLNMPHTLVVFGAAVETQTGCLMNGICEHCAEAAGTADALGERALTYYREHLITDARKIAIHPATGRA